MTATQPRQEYDWEERYGDHWPQIAKATEKLQTVDDKVVCAWCGGHFDHRETQVHHALYSLDGVTLLKDNVIPGEHVFAVCGTKDTPGTCHHALHQEPLWIKDHNNRVAGDRNDENVLFQLQENFRQIREADEMTSKHTTRDYWNPRYRDEEGFDKTIDGSGKSQSWRYRFRQAADRGREVYEESGWMRLVSWVLVSGLIAALAYVSWLNIAPYVALVKALGVGTPNWLLGLPLLGWIVQVWSTAIVTFVGVLIWALVQGLQCLWLLIGLDRQALQGAVHQSQSGRFLVSGQADPTARRIARKARKIPYFFIRWGGLLSLGAYAFDLAVGLSLYPPAASLNAFLFALSSGMWSGIDLPNLAKLLVMLFAFEVVLILLIITLQWIRARQAAATAQ